MLEPVELEVEVEVELGAGVGAGAGDEAAVEELSVGDDELEIVEVGGGLETVDGAGALDAVEVD